MKFPYQSIFTTIVWLITITLFSHTTGARQDENTELIVGVKEAPPFVIKNENGEYSGISIELWEAIAETKKWKFQYQEADIPKLINGLRNSEFDVSVAALTVTSQREEIVDFSHPFYSTGLAIATTSKEASWLSMIFRFFSWEFIVVLGGLSLLLFTVGLVLWVFERRQNTDMFGGTEAEGIGSGFWWAAVTMTTVGYGDKAPITLAGRIIGLIWMFAGIIIISSFTAAIASSLTVNKLAADIESVDDLYNANVLSIDNTASAVFLKQENIKYRHVNSLDEGLSKLDEGEVSALVYDKPILQYLINRGDSNDIYLVPGNIERQDYAFGLPSNSPIREAINTQLLLQIESESWTQIKEKYLGDSE